MSVEMAAANDVERMRAGIAQHLGLHFDDSKSQLLLEVLQRRSEATSMAAAQYLDVLESRRGLRGEVRELARHLTVAETYFFRNDEQFQALRDVAIPARLRAQSNAQSIGRPLRILSAGCATGEEPYTIAIVIHEMLPALQGRPAEIIGMDVNQTVIEKARAARYSRWSLRGMSEERIAHWMIGDGRELRLDERIRRMVTFEERNLLEDDPVLLAPQSYDVVFCRNLIMYLTPEASHDVVNRISRALMPGGFLFLGHAETLRGLTRDFHLLHTHGTFYYQRKHGHEETAEPESAPSAVAAVAPLLAVEIESADSWVQAIARASERVRHLLDRSSVAGTVTRATPSEAKLDLSVVMELLRRERYEEALAVVEAMPDDWSRDPGVLLLRAVLLTHRGNVETAEDACRRLLAIDDLNAGAHYLMSLCREGALDPTGAVHHDQVAIYLDPSFAAPRLHLGLLLKKENRRLEARDHLSRALVLLEREDLSRLLIFGGGFGREALVALCRAELAACGGTP